MIHLRPRLRPAPVPTHAGQTFIRLLTFAATLWPWIGLSVLLGVATVGSGVALLATSAWVIAQAALQPSIAVLEVAIVGVRFFGIARGLLRYFERLVTHEVTFRLLAAIRIWFYERLEPLAPAVLLEHQSGDLLAAVTSDIETLENFYARVIAPPLVALVAVAGMALFFSGYDGRLALALAIVLVAAGAGLPLVVRRLSRLPGRTLVAARAELAATLVDGIQGLSDVLAFGREHDSLARIGAAGEALAGAQRRMAMLRGLHTGAGSLLTGLATLVVVALAVPLVRAGRLSGVDLAVLALAAAACFEAVLPLAPASQHLDTGLAAAERLFSVVERNPLPSERQADHFLVPAAPAFPAVPPGVSVQGLRFRYPGAAGAAPALDGLTFDLPAGTALALVGPSGAGKSTLVNLLLRFWDYDEGQILLDGRELRTLPAEEVRRRIGVVAQHTHLFNATVRDNLLLARPDATEDDLEQAARTAEIHDFIANLPDGYATWIGEAGVRLSGGERQRLAIARALLKDAPILLLDEATANLDPLTERAVLAAIRRVMAGRTTLTITHRLIGLEPADEILVLAGGKIVERGRHQDLLARDGTYRRMWDSQTQTTAVEGL
ncbi:MAG TPA: thiol reductant ABC exporter subunit CydC [Anaerolineae bacterium]